MALRLIKFLIGLVGVALIGVIGVHWGGGATRAEKALSERLTQMLADEGLSWAKAEIGRRKIVLVGAAPSEDIARQAEKAARVAVGRSGVLFGADNVIEARFEIVKDEQPAPIATKTIVVADISVSEEPDNEEPIVAAPGGADRREMQLLLCQEEIARLLDRTPIRFSSGGAAIEGDDESALDAIAASLGLCPEVRITVGGHTDATGSAAGNRALSQRRAEAVAAYLSKRRDGAAQIDAVGYGESRPIASNATREGRAQNRRIEITITSSSVED